MYGTSTSSPSVSVQQMSSTRLRTCGWIFFLLAVWATSESLEREEGGREGGREGREGEGGEREGERRGERERREGERGRKGGRRRGVQRRDSRGVQIKEGGVVFLVFARLATLSPTYLRGCQV